MQHISYILKDEYEHLLQQRMTLQKEYVAQSQRKRESCEQWAETRHDNADYEEAERQQNFIWERIASLQKTIQNVKILLYDELQNTEKKAIIGSTVSLHIDGKFCKHTIWWILTLPGRISYLSPLGQAIYKRQAWEAITFKHWWQQKNILILSVT